MKEVVVVQGIAAHGKDLVERVRGCTRRWKNGVEKWRGLDGALIWNVSSVDKPKRATDSSTTVAIPPQL